MRGAPPKILDFRSIPPTMIDIIQLRLMATEPTSHQAGMALLVAFLVNSIYQQGMVSINLILKNEDASCYFLGKRNCLGKLMPIFLTGFCNNEIAI